GRLPAIQYVRWQETEHAEPRTFLRRAAQTRLPIARPDSSTHTRRAAHQQTKKRAHRGDIDCAWVEVAQGPRIARGWLGSETQANRQAHRQSTPGKASPVCQTFANALCD